MRHLGSIDLSFLVTNVVMPAAITLAGAWLLVAVVGTVALLVVLLVAGLYAPLRGRFIA